MKSYFTLAILILTSMNAHGVILTPGNVLEIRFMLTTPITADTDVVSFGFFGTTFSDGLLSGELYDGDQFLGTYTNQNQGTNQFFFFVTSDSLFNFGDPTVIDFAPLQSHTGDGLLRISLDTGVRVFDPLNSSSGLGESIDAFSYYNTGGIELIGYDLVTVPVPAAFSMFLGVIILWFVKVLSRGKSNNHMQSDQQTPTRLADR